MTTYPSFIEALHADGPARDRADKLALYGQFVGRWDSEIITHAPGGATHHGRGEIHFGWVLEGRAIQDVWMIPRRGDRRPDAPQLPIAGNWYGSTMRVYDPHIDAWHILWTDPATMTIRRQIGRAHGAEIVQEGKLETGGRSRWRFTEITPSSFHWLGEESEEGKPLTLLVEVLARRQ
jgi:hypothetical protein